MHGRNLPLLRIDRWSRQHTLTSTSLLFCAVNKNFIPNLLTTSEKQESTVTSRITIYQMWEPLQAVPSLVQLVEGQNNMASHKQSKSKIIERCAVVCTAHLVINGRSSINRFITTFGRFRYICITRY